MTTETLNKTYHYLKMKTLTAKNLSDKEQAFLYFYENNVLREGNEGRELAQKQALRLIKAFNLA